MHVDERLSIDEWIVGFVQDHADCFGELERSALLAALLKNSLKASKPLFPDDLDLLTDLRGRYWLLRIPEDTP